MMNQRPITALSRAVQTATKTRHAARSWNSCSSTLSSSTVVRQRHHNANTHSLHPSIPITPVQFQTSQQTRTNFSYAGPRKLSDILKIDQIAPKTKVEVSDLWMTYHENKEKVHGLVLDGGVGKSVLGRAAQWYVL